MKRPRMSHIQEHANENNDGSIILFDDVENELLKDGNDDSDNNIEEELEDEDQEMLKEYVDLCLYFLFFSFFLFTFL